MTIAFGRLDVEVIRVMVVARTVMAVLEMVVAVPWFKKRRVLDFMVVDQTKVVVLKRDMPVSYTHLTLPTKA